MKYEHPASQLSTEELEALRGASVQELPEPLPMGADGGFKYRNAFLGVVVVFYVIRLLAFTDAVLANMAIHADERAGMRLYLHFRAVFVSLLTLLYLWSYSKRWQFEKVALITAIVSITALVMDYFNAYIYLHDQATVPMTWALGVRALVVLCLVINALNAHRVPPQKG